MPGRANISSDIPLDTAIPSLSPDMVSVRTIERSANRAAVMGWRDDASLAAMNLVHAAGVDAMRVLEHSLDAITIADGMTGRDTAARDIIRPTMRAELRMSADDWFRAHALTLRRIDPRLEGVALSFAAIGSRPSLPQDEPASTGHWRTPAWLRRPIKTVGSTLQRATNEVIDRTVPDAVREGAEQVAARIVREVGERSGAHDRLRLAARRELSCVWLGPASPDATARPYLIRLLDTIDHVTRQATDIIA